MQRRTQIPASDNLPSTQNQPISSCVTWDKPINLSRPQFPHLWNGDCEVLTSQGYCMRAKTALCDAMGCGPSGSSVHGILQARILERVAVPSSRGFSWPDIKSASLTSPALAGGFFTTRPPGKPPGRRFKGNLISKVLRALPGAWKAIDTCCSLLPSLPNGLHLFWEEVCFLLCISPASCSYHQPSTYCVAIII